VNFLRQMTASDLSKANAVPSLNEVFNQMIYNEKMSFSRVGPSSILDGSDHFRHFWTTGVHDPGMASDLVGYVTQTKSRTFSGPEW
jgi:hypothetical protein